LSEGSAEFLAPDPRLRLYALLMVLAAVVLGAALINWGLPALIHMVATGQVRKRWLCLGFVLFVMLLVGPVILIGFRHRAEGRRVIATQQFPPSDKRVLVRTAVVRGTRAVTLGKAQNALGTALIVLALALLGLTGYAAFLLLR